MTTAEQEAMTKALIENGVAQEQAIKITERLAAVTSSFGKIATKSVEEVQKAYKETTEAVQKAYISMKNMYDSSNKVGDAFMNVKNHAAELLTLTTKFDAFNNIGVDGGKHINTMGQSLTELTNKMGGWDQVVKKYGGTLGMLGGKTMEAAQSLLEHVAQAQHLENAYINLQGASGNLGEVFGKHNEIVSTLSTKVQQYGIQLANASAITGTNIEVTSQFASKLFTLPNLLNAVVVTGKGAGDTTNALTAAMTLASGAGRNNEEVLTAMKVAYEDLGNAQGIVTDNAQKGVAMFALMAEASKKLGLRFEDTQKFLTTVASEFKMVGDNTEGATKVLARF